MAKIFGDVRGAFEAGRCRIAIARERVRTDMGKRPRVGRRGSKERWGTSLGMAASNLGFCRCLDFLTTSTDILDQYDRRQSQRLLLGTVAFSDYYLCVRYAATFLSLCPIFNLLSLPEFAIYVHSMHSIYARMHMDFRAKTIERG